MKDRLLRFDDSLNTRLNSLSKQQDDDLARISANSVSKSAFKIYEKDAANLKVAMHKTQGLVTDYENLNKRAADVDSRCKELEDSKVVARMQEVEDKLRSVSEKQPNGIDELGKTINECEKVLNTHKNGLQALEATNELYHRQFTDINQAIARQSEETLGLSKTIHGDCANGASLPDIMKERHEEFSKKAKKASQNLRTCLDELKAEKATEAARIDELKSQIAEIHTKPSADHQATGFTESHGFKDIIGDLSGTLLTHSSTIAELQKDVARIESEQEQKDDIVGQETSRLDDNLIRHEDLINRLTQRFDATQSSNVTNNPGNERSSLQPTVEQIEQLGMQLIKQGDLMESLSVKVDSLQSKIQALPSSDHIQHISDALSRHQEAIDDTLAKMKLLQSQYQTPLSSTYHPAPTNGILPAKGSNDSVIEALDNKQQVYKREFDEVLSDYRHFKEATTDITNNHDIFITSLQQRFDNLTTDYMVKCMLHHLQTMYPLHPANIQSQLNHMSARHAANIQQIGTLATQVATIDGKMRHIDPVPANVEVLRKYIESSSKAIETAQNESNKSIADVKKDSLILIEKVKDEFQQQLKVNQEERQEGVSIIEQELHSHLERIQGLQQSLQSVRTEYSTINNQVATVANSVRTMQASLANINTARGSEEHSNKNEHFEKIRISIEEGQKKLTDMWHSFINEMAKIHGNIRSLHENIDALNQHCGINITESPSTSRPETAPEPTYEQGDASSSEERDMQLSQASMSLGQPSSPVRASTDQTDHTLREEESEDDEPILRNRKRKRRDGGVDSPWGKRGR